MGQPVVHTLIVTKNPNSKLGPEIALTTHQDKLAIPGVPTPTYSHSPEAALSVLGATIIPGYSYEQGDELVRTQTGITTEDLVYVDVYEEGELDHIVYAILLRRDRLPLRFTALEDCEISSNWFFLNNPPEDLGFYAPLVREAAIKLKQTDKDAQRAVNAARTVKIFTNSFGHGANPLKRPKQADKRAAAWVNSELKAETLNKKAVNTCLGNLEDNRMPEISGDRANQLYRMAWRAIAADTHRKTFS